MGVSIKSFSLVLTAFSLLLVLQVFSCKSPVVPPDNWPPSTPSGPDTTSHDFVWQIDTLGDGNSSILNDVFIVDENNIWAVGEIYLRDSTGQFDPEIYGLARWDGIKWNYTKVPYHDFGSTQTYPGKLNAVYGFAASDIYVSSSANLLHWNGTSWTERAFFMTAIPFDGQVSRMWGSSGSNLYCVGSAGAIYHFNGSAWQKLESGTTMNLRDIWGDDSGASREILAVGRSGLDRIILKIELTGVVDTVSATGIDYSLASVWFSTGKKYVAVGDGIFRKDSLAESIWRGFPLELTDYYSLAVRGSDSSNIIVAGSFGDVLHFNGASWKQYTELIMNGTFYAAAVKQQTVVAVGQVGNRAIAVIGRQVQISP